MKNLEIEFKWNAQEPRAFLRMLNAIKKEISSQYISPKKQLYIADVYVDHADHQFEKQKLAFRVRHVGKIWEATFKTRTKLVNGKAVRREETQQLIGVRNLKQALSNLDAQKRWKQLSVKGLNPLFTILNKRCVRTIKHPFFQAELAFDDCVICVGEKRALLKEIELELKCGNARAFDQFVKKISIGSGLKRAASSKVKIAVGLLREKIYNELSGPCV